MKSDLIETVYSLGVALLVVGGVILLGEVSAVVMRWIWHLPPSPTVSELFPICIGMILVGFVNTVPIYYARKRGVL